MEATSQEVVRQHLGFETQRHWAQRAIRRTAPALLSLFSLVTLFVNQQMANKKNVDTAFAERPGTTRSIRPSLRCFGAGEEGVVGTRRGDFLRVGAGKRHGKSPAGVHREANRCGLLCSLMAKVELRSDRSSRWREESRGSLERTPPACLAVANATRSRSS